MWVRDANNRAAPSPVLLSHCTERPSRSILATGLCSCTRYTRRYLKKDTMFTLGNQFCVHRKPRRNLVSALPPYCCIQHRNGVGVPGKPWSDDSFDDNRGERWRTPTTRIPSYPA